MLKTRTEMKRGAPMKQTGFKRKAVPVRAADVDIVVKMTEADYRCLVEPYSETGVIEVEHPAQAKPIKKAAFKAKRTKRKAGTSDPAYMALVAGLGCRLCRLLGLGFIPCEVHHRRTGTGGGRRAPDRETVGLCPEHHRGASGIHGLGRKLFERTYGWTELQLIAMTKADLGVADETTEPSGET